ncbi:MAG: hypothetical protein AAB468_01070 [Patescibacteria group bacterium]
MRKYFSQGFVLFYAVLLVSIVLTVSLSLFNITYKQILISTTARESLKSYYAALTGLECAHYWDNVYPYVDPGSAPKVFGAMIGNNNDSFASASGPGPSCLSNVFTISHPSNQVSQFSLALDNGACVDVKVTKRIPADPDQTDTLIEASGYNIGSGSGCVSSNPRRTERSLLVDYNDYY